jgi:hypothetical protein
MGKVRKVIKYADLPEDAAKALTHKYPGGWRDFVRKITTPNGETFYAIDIDSESGSYLVKMNVKVDSKSFIEKNSQSFLEKLDDSSGEKVPEEDIPAREKEE